jgi:hypothetical protein
MATGEDWQHGICGLGAGGSSTVKPWRWWEEQSTAICRQRLWWSGRFGFCVRWRDGEVVRLWSGVYGTRIGAWLWRRTDLDEELDSVMAWLVVVEWDFWSELRKEWLRVMAYWSVIEVVRQSLVLN